MEQVAIIKAAHDWMVLSCEADLSQAVARGDMDTAKRLEGTRQIFDRAVFVVLFGRFEMAVTETFEQARNARSANPDWRSRRGWDVPAYRVRRIAFETKLALVMDRQTEAHGRIMRAYALRNHCAHGGSTKALIPIEEFVADLYAWRALLRR